MLQRRETVLCLRPRQRDGPLAVGATSILWPGAVTPPVVYDLIERYRPTLFYSVPTHFAMMLAHHREGRDFDLSSIRSAVSAGEALPPVVHTRFRERFGVEILDGIGSTEVLHIFISNRPGQSRAGSSGRLVPGYDAQIVDEQGAAVPRRDRRAADSRGLDLRALLLESPRKDQRDDRRALDSYRRSLPAGRGRLFWFAGRSDDMLKVGGQWVSPAELEQTLVEHPDVSACGVAGCADRDGLIKPIAYVVVRDGGGDAGAGRDAAAIRARAAGRLQTAAVWSSCRCYR